MYGRLPPTGEDGGVLLEQFELLSNSILIKTMILVMFIMDQSVLQYFQYYIVSSIVLLYMAGTLEAKRNGRPFAILNVMRMIVYASASYLFLLN